MKEIAAAILLLFGVAGCGFAQTKQYKFRHLSINQGLSHNQVLAFYKDQKGFMWVGTASGLNRYDGHSIRTFKSNLRDPASLTGNGIGRIFGAPDGTLVVVAGGQLTLYDPLTEKFDRNTADFFKKFHLPDGNLLDIRRDSKSVFWFVLPEAIVAYDSLSGRAVTLKNIPDDSTSIDADPITAIVCGSASGHWVVHGNGTIERIAFTGAEWKVVHRHSSLTKRNGDRRYDYRLIRDSTGDLWLWANNDNQGIYHFDVGRDVMKNITATSDGIRLNTNLVSGIVEDDHGVIWVATDHGGINLIDKDRKTVSFIYHRDEDGTSLGQNSITTMFKDDTGIIWIGTYKQGVSYFHENIYRFTVYKYYATDPNALPYSDVNRFVEDEDGNIWIGTNGGGLIRFNRSAGTFTQFRNIPGDPESLSSDVIVSLCIDREKKLWIGTYYGGLNMFDGRKFHRYQNNPRDSTSLSGRSVWEIFEDSKNNLWIGTLEGGINRMNRKTGTFQRIHPAAPDATDPTYISEIVEDRNGNIWFGTSVGIDVFSPETNTYVHYEYNENDTTSLGGNNILDILEDSNGNMLIATQGNLNIFDPRTREFRVIGKKEGLPDGTILTLEEDNAGHIWMGTSNGLVELVPREDRPPIFRVYTELDGLQSLQFNENASYKTRSGELIFGGPNGFNIFHPASVTVKRSPRKVTFTDFQLFQRSVGIEEKVNGRIILPRSISEAEKIILPAGQNFFSVEFSSLDYLQPEKNEFLYKLEGLHAEWLPVDKQTRRIVFTTVNPGDYILKVKTVDAEGVSAAAEASLPITLLPPFYRTKVAFVLYMLLLGVILYIARKLVQQREKLKFAIAQERQEAIRMHELDMMKIRFFTNVSHEFRTPLTLILTPLERMLKQVQEPDQRSQYMLIQRNAKRLLTLVNQLLDFRKMEVQELRFSPSEGDIVRFIHETVLSFSDLSEKKEIRLIFDCPLTTLETVFDQDKLEKIIFNLLSNAFKFTPEHGEVRVAVNFAREDEKGWLTIVVEDTGIGIPSEKLDRIFERFFQNDLPRTMVNQGSGIGLAITKEFVRICQGEIAVMSEPGKGTRFTVRLPLQEVISNRALAGSGKIEVQPMPAGEFASESADQHNTTDKKKYALLLVEDNDDFRFYLKDNLKQQYRIYEAADGEEGWRKVVASNPDLVISDVMMPRMDGVELCQRIKGDERVSHIPVILLTARSSEEQRMKGFQTGADDYVTKPFNFEILESRIRNLIALREKSHKAFRKTLDIKASELNITPLDTQFIERAVKCVEQHVSSAEFSVEDLAKELGVSRAYLYKKVVALTGKSPLEFIRTIRLQHAAQLLEKSQLSVAEVAYRVGFNNPKYFARYFKEEFNILPSAYATMRKGSTT